MFAYCILISDVHLHTVGLEGCVVAGLFLVTFLLVFVAYLFWLHFLIAYDCEKSDVFLFFVLCCVRRMT